MACSSEALFIRTGNEKKKKKRTGNEKDSQAPLTLYAFVKDMDKK